MFLFFLGLACGIGVTACFFIFGIKWVTRGYVSIAPKEPAYRSNAAKVTSVTVDPSGENPVQYECSSIDDLPENHQKMLLRSGIWDQYVMLGKFFKWDRPES